MPKPKIDLSVCELDVKKLKILAIHGYRQDAKAFQEKTGSFRKLLQKYAQFNYITAPHKVVFQREEEWENGTSGRSELNEINEEEYGWFFNRDDNSFRGIRKGGPAIGFEQSVKYIESVFEQEGPFDGVFGFSQGACFVGLLCDLQQRGLTTCKFDFAIMVSGFKSGCLPHLKYFSDKITLPSLHVFGENDNIIPTEMSAALSECFEEPYTVRHSGGHYVPATAVQKPAYLEFFKKLA